MNNLTVSASPHITKPKNTTRRIMIDVMIALSPAIVAATIFFGYHVLINVVACMVFCFGFELLYTFILKKGFSKKAFKESSCWDFSCLVTAIILALNLPSKMVVNGWNLNIYHNLPTGMGINAADYIVFSFDTILVCFFGSLAAIVLVKMLFGGIGKNFANPAATARVILLLTFGLGIVNSTGAFGLAGSTGATWLGGERLTNNQSMFLNMFLGNRGTAAVGETSIAALLLGYLYLSIRKVIDFRIPLILVGSAAIFALIFDGLIVRELSGARLLNNMFAHIMGGGLVFGAIFMATDYSTSPNTFRGNLIFVVGIALFTVLIRVFTDKPEGMSFAILFMNLLVPLIDKYIYPKPFGYFKPTATNSQKHKEGINKNGND